MSALPAYDHPAAALWDADTPEPWRLLTLIASRLITAELGITHKALREQARLACGRVIEYQRRGLIHFHAVVRLDAKTRLHLQMVEPGVI
ncbi:replication initiator [Actinomadura coerulea]|uniref:replication initiator n=1 Tax=Actinomadura coerulea TaxID=46159 RepID=UPI0034474A9F